MILTGLRPLYKLAKKHGYTYAMFDFKKNNAFFMFF